jgi:endonuclease-3
MIDKQKTLAVHQRLTEVYGTPVNTHSGTDPLDELIATILSQNTSDVNSDRAFRRLKERFPTWMEVLEADPKEVYEAIKPAGLGAIKTPRIQQTLEEILVQRGELSLDFLADMEMDEARGWLCSLKGIGPKTAACVLMFALDMPALPVDTHVHRVSRRLGLIGPRISAEKAHYLLESVVPPKAVLPFHINMIRHGRRVCRALNPQCTGCPLYDLCDRVGVDGPYH